MQKLTNLLPLVIPALVLSAPVDSAEWTRESGINLRAGYNDNVRLSARDHDTVQETALSPFLRLGVASRNKGILGDAGFSIRRFSGGSGRESSSVLDREDYRLTTNAYYSSEKSNLRGSISYNRDSTLDSELNETGEVIEDRATRNRIVFSPSWDTLFNEKTKLSFGYQFTNVGYSDDPGISDLVEYDYHVLSSSLVRALTPRIQGTLSASYSLYKPENNIDSGSLSLQLGMTRLFSESLTASFQAGQRRTKSDGRVPAGFCFGPGTFPTCSGGTPIQTGFAEEEVENSGAVYSASITKTLESGSLGASLSRTSSPAADGEVLDTTRLGLSGKHGLTDKLQTSLNINLTQREAIVNSFGQSSDQSDETSIRIKPEISYRWRRTWNLTGQYEYARNKYINSSTATRNAVYLNIGYRPEKSSWSR